MLAWLAVLVRDSLLSDRAKAIALDPHATPAELHHGVTLARQARLLNPNRSVAIGFESSLYLREGRAAAAVRIYERMLRAEPKFAEVWYLLAIHTAASDPRRSAQARAQLRRLDPLDRGASGG